MIAGRDDFHGYSGYRQSGCKDGATHTGGATYAVNPDGGRKWVHPASNSIWTAPVVDDNGVIYWGSVDTSVFVLNPDGSQK